LEVRWKHSSRVNGERYKGSKSSGSEKMRNTMEKTLRQEDIITHHKITTVTQKT